jgi:hypothetical protein
MNNGHDGTAPSSDMSVLIEKAYNLSGWAREIMEDSARLMKECQEIVKAAEAIKRSKRYRIPSTNGLKDAPEYLSRD